jgi:hypothetical protein
MGYNEVLQLRQQKDAKTKLSTEEIEKKTQTWFYLTYGYSPGGWF